MRELENIEQVASLQPDYMGFIFYSKSPRYVGEKFKLPPNFPTNIIRVGVFVNESTDAMLKKVDQFKLDFLQLHGAETLQQCEELKNHNIKIIKTLSIGSETDLTSAKFYSAAVNYFLFDTKGKYYGGNAKAFDWKVLERYDQQVPFFLSGGLSADNVEAALMLKDMNLFALDVNSGVEVSPAMKDLSKIKRIQNILLSNTES